MNFGAMFDALRAQFRYPPAPPDHEAQPAPDLAAPAGSPNPRPGLMEGDPFWTTYLEEAAKYDKVLIDQWNEDLDSLLIFAGLFSGILTAFIIEARKGLQEDLQSETNALLARMVDLMTPIAQRINAVPSSSAGTKSASVAVNVLWFTSLTASLASALGAIMAKRWVRRYQYGDYAASPMMTARRRQLLFDGLESWNFAAVLSIIPVLIHVALVLFFAGLILFLFGDNSAVGAVVTSLCGVVLGLYLYLTIVPLRSTSADCLYGTPLTFARNTPDDLLLSTLDQPAISFLVKQSTSEISVVAAAKALSQLELDARELDPILEEIGPNILGQVDVNLIIANKAVSLRPGISTADMRGVLWVLKQLVTRPLPRTAEEFDAVTTKLGSAIQIMEEPDAVIGPDVMALKTEMILTHSGLALRRYDLMTRDIRPPLLALDPWSEEASLRPLVAPLIVAVSWRRGGEITEDALTVVRALASVGAVLSRTTYGDEAYWTKIDLIDLHSDVMCTTPLPPRSVLQAALVGLEGCSFIQQDAVFLDTPSSNSIDDFISNLLERLFRVEGDEPPGVVSYRTTRALLMLIRRLHPLSEPDDPQYRDRNMRLTRAVTQFMSSKDLSCAFQATYTLYHLKFLVSLPPQRVTTLLNELLKWAILQREQREAARARRRAAREVDQPTRRAEHIEREASEVDPKALGALVHAIILHDPGLTLYDTALTENAGVQNAGVLLVQECAYLVEQHGSLSPILIVEMMRGLTALSYPDAPENKALLEAVTAFFNNGIPSNSDSEITSVVLALILKLMTEWPAEGAAIFVGGGGFTGAVQIMNPRNDIPLLVSVLRSVISSIVTVENAEEVDLNELKTRLNNSALFLIMSAKRDIINEVREHRLEWDTLMNQLGEAVQVSDLRGYEALRNVLR